MDEAAQLSAETGIAEEKPQSCLPHFARAAAWTGGSFGLALVTGMAPLLYPQDGGLILLGMLATIPGCLFSVNMAALSYSQGIAYRYAAKGEMFRPPAPDVPRLH